MTIVFENLDLPSSGTPQATVQIQLWGAGRPTIGRRISTGSLIAGVTTIIPDAIGFWQADLAPNIDILPENTTWRIERLIGCESFVSFISVPATGGAYEVLVLEDDPMNAIAPSELSVHAANHELHGGGLEVCYAELITNVTITGTAGTPQKFLTIVAPDSDRPLELSLIGQVVASSGTANVQFTISADFFGSPFFRRHKALYGIPVVGTEISGRSYDMTTRIAPHSPGTFWATAANLSGTGIIQGAQFVPSFLQAVRL